ncbi:MAG: septum formation inhibitor Maf [Acidimicrobiia bacterium]|nr:septum formation inhibitor Maf [Acidimicrobiia bacterium]
MSWPEVILASASPRRLELLRQIGIEPTVEPADVDETLDPGADLAVAVVELARAKADAVARSRLLLSDRPIEAVVIGADTLVVVDGEPLGKPASPADAAAMLRRLSGRSHQVMTGVAVVHLTSGRTLDAVATTDVHVRAITDDEIDAYIATGEPFDKAGAYAIQGRAAVFVEGISGDHSNVVGLPLPLVDRLLRTLRQA